MDYRNTPLKDIPIVEAERTILFHEKDYSVTRMVSAPGRGPAPHHHVNKQVIYILYGSGLFKRGEEEIQLKAGDSIAIDSDVPHSFVVNYEETSWLEFFTPGREDFN